MNRPPRFRGGGKVRYPSKEWIAREEVGKSVSRRCADRPGLAGRGGVPGDERPPQSQPACRQPGGRRRPDVQKADGREIGRQDHRRRVPADAAGLDARAGRNGADGHAGDVRAAHFRADAFRRGTERHRLPVSVGRQGRAVPHHGRRSRREVLRLLREKGLQDPGLVGFGFQTDHDQGQAGERAAVFPK